jgi:hypothetical protein
MLAQQVRDEANLINELLSRRRYTRRRTDRRRLLAEAVDASLRALPVLRQEPLITDTAAYLERSEVRLHHNGEALIEEMRHDALLLQLFISAESRLLADIGVSAGVIEATVASLTQVITEDASQPEALGDKLGRLQAELERDLRAIQHQADRDGMAARVAGVLGVLGGSLVVTANAGVAVASHAVLAGPMAASVSAGSAMVGRALDDVLSPD